MIDPTQFLKDSEVSSFSVNTIDEKKDKLSDCEKSFFPKEDGTIGCKCARRMEPPKFEVGFYKNAFQKIKNMKGETSDILAKFNHGSQAHSQSPPG